MAAKKKKNIVLYNILFVLITGGLFLFLWVAPPEKTTHLPHDDDHERFMDMGKKEAEKFCGECHGNDKLVPFSEDHPPKYRCLFCHKRVKEDHQLTKNKPNAQKTEK